MNGVLTGAKDAVLGALAGAITAAATSQLIGWTEPYYSNVTTGRTQMVLSAIAVTATTGGMLVAANFVLGKLSVDVDPLFQMFYYNTAFVANSKLMGTVQVVRMAMQTQFAMVGSSIQSYAPPPVAQDHGCGCGGKCGGCGSH